MTRKLLIAVVLAAMGFASVAAALGLGSISSESTLNQPLQARIELLSADPDDIGRISARLASPEAFERAGLERPFFLSRLDFDVVREGDAVFLEVTTNGAVKEPFLDFLVEVNWPNGRLLREYTLLLDPPTYTDDIAPAVAASGVGAAAAAGDADDPAAQAAPAAPAASPVSAPTGEAAEAAVPARYGPVQANDTLYSIADQVRPDGVSINQTMLALLRTNPDAFIGSNINVLRRGAILRMPERAELTRLSRAEANAEVREQMARWQEQRSAPAAGAGTEVAEADAADTGAEAADAETAAGAPDAEAETAGSEVVAAAAEDEGAAAAGEAGGELRLVAPEESAGVDATTSLAEADLEATPQAISRLQEQLALLEESNAGLEAENADLREQVSGLREELGELERMINLRLAQDLPIAGDSGAEAGAGEDTDTGVGDTGLDAPVAAGGDAAADAGASGDAEGPPAGGDAVEETAATAGGGDEAGAAGGQADTAQADAGPAEEPAAADPSSREPAAAESPAPVSFLEMMLADTRMLTYAGGGIALLLLLLLLVQRRRRAASAEEVDEGLPAPQVAPAAGAAAGDATAGRDRGHEADGIAAEAGDPLEEAELYLAYSRADQAQEVLDRALGEDPDNLRLRTRLLEVLAERGDRAGFEAEAQVLHTQVADHDDPHWQRIAGLGRALAPEHPLFSTEEDAAEEDDEDGAGAPAAIGAGRAAGAAAATPAPADAGEDERAADDTGEEDFGFELNLDEEPEQEQPEYAEPMHGAAGAGAPDEAPASGRETAGAYAAEEDTLGDLEFDLDELGAEEPGTAATGRHDDERARDGGGDLEFSLDEPDSASGTAAGEQAEEPPEFRLDDDLEPAAPAERGDANRRAGAADEDTDLDFGDFSFDEPDGKDDEDGGDIDGLDEVGTKLDLARAYMDMGDSEGARSLLDEVSEEGNEAQRREAEELLARTG